MRKPASRPQAIIFENHCRANIQRIVQKASRIGATYTPHFKTHQSAVVANWFRDEGITGITVSSPEMAMYFADHNWDDITIAFPFYQNQIGTIRHLSKNCSLRLMATDPKDVVLLDSETDETIRILIEIDAGYGRSGLTLDDSGSINAIIQKVDQSSHLAFAGFYIHDGATYHVKGQEAVRNLIQRDLNAFSRLQTTYSRRNLDYCLGDTPSCSLCDDLDPATELTPGNLVFYDLMQIQAGSCTWDDIGLLVRVPVAQEKPETEQCIIHGGAVHFSKDNLMLNGVQTYGQPVVLHENQTITPVQGSRISALSQEHGTVDGLSAIKKAYGVEQLREIWVCPVHSCLTANLFEMYHTPEGVPVTKRILS